MARFHTTIDSTRSPEAAFAYLADFAHAAQWDPGVVEARRVDGGALGAGSRFALVASFAGRRVPLDYVITEVDAPRRVVLRAENRLFRSVDTIAVAPRENGSRVTYDARLTPKGALWLLAWPLAVTFHRVGERARRGLARSLGS
ncbi:MAG: SRPBCC family protein [Acidimicrobiales bacterium]